MASMHFLANPARFQRFSARTLPWLGALDGAAVGRRPVSRPGRLAARLPAGRDRADHVRPCAGGLDGDGRLRAARGAGRGALVWRHPLADLAGTRGGAGGRRLCAGLPGHRLALGPADVGHVVGVGRAADLGAGAVLPLSRPHRAQPRLRRSRARRRGPPRSWRWSASSTCRSSSSRSTGGTRCTSRPR